MTTILADEFRTEYEQERRETLRRRVLWYLGCTMAITVPRLLVVAVMITFGIDPDRLPLRLGLVLLAAGILYLAGTASAFGWVRHRRLRRRHLLGLVSLVIVTFGLIDIVFATVAGRLIVPPGTGHILSGPYAPLNTLVSLFIMHFFAALFIPWTWKEALRPIVPLLVASALLTFLLADIPLDLRLRFIAASPLAAVPGVALCWWRSSRYDRDFVLRMLRGRYGVLRRELGDARRIHESLFPEPVDDGPVRFHYRYRPMHDIGGDFVYARNHSGGEDAPNALSVVIIDVTGHGISAALTVNRLHGELERLFAERPAIDPGTLLAALNHYVFLTLAGHRIFATAICLRVTPERDTVEWASAGHPPAFLSRAGGAMERLESTAVMLGVVPDGEFDAAPETRPLGPGELVVAVTDGLTEATDERLQMLRTEGTQSIITAATESWRERGGRDGQLADSILRVARKRGYSVSADDVLVVELLRRQESAPEGAPPVHRGGPEHDARPG